jgi:hypothetical protein
MSDYYKGYIISLTDAPGPGSDWVADRGEAEDGDRIFATTRAELIDLIDEALELEEA